MNIKLFATGGTIDKIYFDANSEFQVDEPTAADILKQGNVTFQYEIESILKKDSLDLTDKDRDLIFNKVKNTKHNKILITHGTDTLTATANKLLAIKDKTIVLTASMQPAIIKRSDASFNIGVAIAAVQLLQPGVYIAMNGKIFNPRKVKKNLDKKIFEEI